MVNLSETDQKSPAGVVLGQSYKELYFRRIYGRPRLCRVRATNPRCEHFRERFESDTNLEAAKRRRTVGVVTSCKLVLFNDLFMDNVMPR